MYNILGTSVMTRVKSSYGIALCRYNDKYKKNEIVLIKKRFSYNFFNFVFGHYKKSSDTCLRHMFDNMSYAEKIDILSFDFSVMWYRIWLNNPEKNTNLKDMYEKHKYSIRDNSTGSCDKFSIQKNTMIKLEKANEYDIYFKKKDIFERVFMNENGARRLKRLICISNNSEIIWEIPKGGKNMNETDIDTAVREFEEETNINPNEYMVLYNTKPIIEIVQDSDIIYKNVYFIAECKGSITPSINFNNYKQISEVEQIKWVSIDDIKFMNLNARMHDKLILLYKRVLSVYSKSRIKNETL